MFARVVALPQLPAGFARVTALALALVVSAARAVLADRIVDVELAGDTPFTAAQLSAAVRVRLDPSGAPLRLSITVTNSVVHVVAPGGERDVDIGDLRGVDAARLVALAADDLIDERVSSVAATPGNSPESGASGVSGAASSLELSGSSAAVSRASDADTVAFTALGGVSAWSGTLATGALEVSRAQGGWLVAFSAGGGSLLGGPVELATAVVRVELGLRLGGLDVRAGAVAEPIFVVTGSGDSTVLFGASASAHMRIPVAATFHIVLAAGADAFATQTEYRLAGNAVMTTPTIAPWLTCGVEIAL